MSDRRVGWIEAKKQCEARKAHLVSFEFVSKQADILKWVGEKTRRRRGKFWTGGNDIQVCIRFKQDKNPTLMKIIGRLCAHVLSKRIFRLGTTSN